MSWQERATHFWEERGAYVLAAAFVAIFFSLMVAKHNAFNTRVYDFARFSQAIWSVLEGAPLFSSIGNRSILGDHFSPIMALAAPLLLIWRNERVLFLVQVVNVAVTGLILTKMIKEKRPELAPWFLLAFLLNPALHEATLFEFRRIIFALPFLALALYALSIHNRKLMLFGLIFALLAKENIGFFVFMIGFYLLVFERDWKWGVATMALGAGWLVVVSLWVIPAFNDSSAAGGLYPQLYYFSFLGSSYTEIAQTILADPLVVLRQMFQVPQLSAIGRILLPLGLVLPFLAPHWLLIAVPYVAILFLSADSDMYQLEKWYPATLLVVLFAAIAVGWDRLPKRWERWAMALLLLATVIGYFLFSPAPFGGRYDPGLYEVTEHDRLAAELVESVPSDARVASQPSYVPHLTHRFDVYHYPWIDIGKENIDYFVLDRYSQPYPFDPQEINAEITNMVADPSYVVEEEVDGIYLIRSSGEQLPAFPVNRVAEGAIRLDRAEVAVEEENGFFRNSVEAPIRVKPGDQIRVTLYWEALAAPNAERTVSVRIADADGFLVAQHDSIPVGGSKPTSWWEEGWEIRDVYYLTIPPGAHSGTRTLDVVLYDTHTLETVPFDGDIKILTLQSVIIEEQDT